MPFPSRLLMPIGKLTNCLLAPEHAVGGAKYKYLNRAGYEKDRHGELAAALFRHVCWQTFHDIQHTPHGIPHRFRGPLGWASSFPRYSATGRAMYVQAGVRPL